MDVDTIMAVLAGAAGLAVVGYFIYLRTRSNKLGGEGGGSKGKPKDPNDPR